ncbi:MAG: winged helix-turn-helix transcriptional regulator [Chloroflexi bacterium]|nr:winged helix-turn-helix transcriptional regulator [Chloroflexota bacterium]
MTSSKQFTTALREWSEVFMSRTMREWVRFVKSSGLSLPQFSALMRLYYHGGCGMSEMSAHLDVTAAATSQMVDRLVHAGLIERVEDPSDRRAQQLTISEKGRALVEKGIEARNRWWEYLPAALNAEQRAAVVEALNSLAEAARALEASDTKTPT